MMVGYELGQDGSLICPFQLDTEIVMVVLEVLCLQSNSY
jgi:hypothetical protein